MNFRFRKAPFYFTVHMVHLKIEASHSQQTDFADIAFHTVLLLRYTHMHH